MPKSSVILHLAGTNDGAPTLDDLIIMAKSLTGRDPTPEEIAEAKELLDKRRNSVSS